MDRFTIFIIIVSVIYPTFKVVDLSYAQEPTSTQKSYSNRLGKEFDFGDDEVGSAKGDLGKKLDTPKLDDAPKASITSLSSTDPNKNALNEVVGVNKGGINGLQERIATLNEDQLRMRAEAQKRVDAAKREAERQKRIAAENAAAASRLSQERVDRALREAQAALDKNKNIPRQTLNGINDPAIRENLVNAVAAQELNTALQEEKKKSELNLAQLLQMAAVTMQAATAMNSMEGTSPAQSSQNFDPTKAVAPKAALVGRGPASLGDKKNTISEKSLESENLTEGDQAKEKSAKDKETIAKVKEAVEAAEKRKKIQAMRLKQKLREKANAQGKGAVDTEALFGGSLNQGTEAVASGDEQTEEAAAKESAMAVSSVYQAAREGFSLAGADTDREVGQIVSEAERDLSSEDMSAGVLGRESPSLFARVRAVHEACQRQKCVVNR